MTISILQSKFLIDKTMSDDEYVPETEEDDDDFDIDEVTADDDEVDFNSDEIEDCRDVEGKKVKFINPQLHRIKLSDEHIVTKYIIPDEERMTSNYLTEEEMTEAIGIRVTQIERAAPVFTDVEGYDDAIKQARKELLDKRSPLILEREMKRSKGIRYVEHWKVNEMVLPRSRQEIIRLTNRQMIDQLGTLAEPKIDKPVKKTVKKEKSKSPSKAVKTPSKKTPTKKVIRKVKKK